MSRKKDDDAQASGFRTRIPVPSRYKQRNLAGQILSPPAALAFESLQHSLKIGARKTTTTGPPNTPGRYQRWGIYPPNLLTTYQPLRSRPLSTTAAHSAAPF